MQLARVAFFFAAKILFFADFFYFK
jgi:hypothetical protein